MINIAITGGIASGKSVTTQYLQNLGYTVIDADKMAREITGPGGKAMPFIKEHFGPQYINEDGSLNRAAMRDLVFNNPDKLMILEAGTTDVVIEDIEKIKAERAAAGDEILFFDIPLLFEKKQQDKYDAVWVVTSDREIRKKRIIERDGMDEHMADLMIDSQEDEDRKVESADFAIYNNGDIAELYRAIDDALSHYINNSNS